MTLAGQITSLATRIGVEVKAVRAEMATAIGGRQPLDADLTTIAAIDPTAGAGIMGTPGTGWQRRTLAQVKTDLSLGNVDNTSDANKPVSTATNTALLLRMRPLGAFVGSTSYVVNDMVKGPAPYYGQWRCISATSEAAFSGWSGGKWEYVGGSGYGTAAAKPSATSGPNGYTYTETDTGDPYIIEGGAWVLNAPQASGQLVTSTLLTNTYDIQGNGTTYADITGGSLVLPASAGRGILVECALCVVITTGTAAIASQETPQVIITDSGNATLLNGPAVASETVVQVTAVSVIHHRRMYVTALLPAPVSAQTIKLRAKLRNTAPTNWTSCTHVPAFGAGGGAGDLFRAVYV